MTLIFFIIALSYSLGLFGLWSFVKALTFVPPFIDIIALLSPRLAIYILLSNINDTNAQDPERSDCSKVLPHFCLKNSSSIFSNVSFKANFISNGKFLFSRR